MADGTYPRATRLQDGSILGVHTSFQSGQNVIAAVRSTDNGVTWTFVGEVCPWTVLTLKVLRDKLTTRIGYKRSR